MVLEVIGGWLSGSLALLADAAHMLSDVAALALSLFAAWVARRPPSTRHTFGYYRTEILAALVNGAVLLAVSAWVLVEAWTRLAEPRPVQGGLMLAVASGGLAVNAVGLVLLHGSRSSGLNLRAAWLHVLGDALGSVAAIVAGILIAAFGWTWADPLASSVIALLVIRSTWGLLRETVGVLMEGAPGHVDVDAIRDAIADVEGVAAVHDLHVWSITSGMVSLSCHVVWTDEAPAVEALSRVHDVLAASFGIHHVTVQVEPIGFVERERCL